MPKSVTTFAAVGAVLVALALTDTRPGSRPPPASDLSARGADLFARSCSSCHGEGGAGGRASALAGNRRIQSLTDAEIQGIIRNGTSAGMPPFPALTAAELESVTAFVRSLVGSPDDRGSAVGGDAVAGARFFFGDGKCASCHLAGGNGAAIGPDLSNIGRRMTPEELSRSLVEPCGHDRAGLRDGERDAERRNEGTRLHSQRRQHTLPLQDMTGRLVVVDKHAAMITREPGSIMPALKATPEQQRDLIAYLKLTGATGATGAMGATGATGAIGATGATGAKDFDEILKPRPGDWPTYHGRLDGNRYSAHTQINTTTVGRLAVRWVYSLRGFDNETTPLVLDGVMYVSATNQVSALDAATGREIWRFSRPRTPGFVGDAAIGFNRGVAVLGPRVFLVTDNAHLVALSRVNGALLWEVVLPENLAAIRRDDGATGRWQSRDRRRVRRRCRHQRICGGVSRRDGRAGVAFLDRSRAR